MMYSSWDMLHDRRTDKRTDGWMDGRMEVTCRGGCQLKTSHWVCIAYNTSFYCKVVPNRLPYSKTKAMLNSNFYENFAWIYFRRLENKTNFTHSNFCIFVKKPQNLQKHIHAKFNIQNQYPQKLIILMCINKLNWIKQEKLLNCFEQNTLEHIKHIKMFY